MCLLFFHITWHFLNFGGHVTKLLIQNNNYTKESFERTEVAVSLVINLKFQFRCFFQVAGNNDSNTLLCISHTKTHKDTHIQTHTNKHENREGHTDTDKHKYT